MDINAEESNKGKKKKRTPMIVCAVIGIIIIGIAAVVFILYNWQKNNIEALRYAMDYSSDEIADQLEDSDKQTQERLSEIAGVTMRPLTDEEARLLADGEITQEEAVLLITGEATLEAIRSGEYLNAEEKSPASESGNDVSSEYGRSGENRGSGGSSGGQDVDISSTLAKIYALEGEFTASVESLISQAKADLGSMSTSELIRKYSGLASSMEGDCDSRLEALLGELESKLDASGGDKSIINEIRDAYNNKKSLKKAELLSKFGN